MVNLRKKVISGKTYYYLGHSYRENGRVKYKETYVGDAPPSITDMLKIRKELLLDIYKEKWFKKFEVIKRAYANDWKRMPLEAREKFLEYFVVKFTYDTNKIEGSSLSFQDTAELLLRHVSPKNKPIRDIKETEAHRKVFYEMIAQKGDLTLEVLLEWHKELFIETKPDLAGRIRDFGVYIGGSRHLPPPAKEVKQRLTELFKWYHKEEEKMNAVELAARMHLKFETIHPFGDGNGRTGRLILNFILHKKGYPMSNIKYINRRGYYNALERANVNKDETIFVQWFFRMYVKENTNYLKPQ
ncbi:MAG TPA: Fic family protein [Candidatus Acidoferrum sp.]|nr:Fic family protein [Candidatus Acidoferrum sp.]